MKKNTWIWIAAAAVAYWYFIKKKKTGPGAPSAVEAGNAAKQIVSEAIDQTTFLPDETTFRDMYAADQAACK